MVFTETKCPVTTLRKISVIRQIKYYIASIPQEVSEIHGTTLKHVISTKQINKSV